MKNFNVSLKKIICLLIAVLMLISVAGCAKKGKTVKKVIKKKVIVVNDDNNVTDETPSDDDGDDNEEEETTIVTPEKEKKNLGTRPLPEEKTSKTKYVETFTPEFEYNYADWSGPDGYVIVYSHSNANNKVTASRLVTFFKDNYKVTLADPVKDTDPIALNAEKKILVGDTAFKTSSLAETDYAVTLLANGDLFFEGGHYAMVEAAEKWFETVEVKAGKVATLTGKQESFTSTVTLNGKTYNYVWGDEYDGDFIYDSNKWSQTTFENGGDIKNVFGDRSLNTVENGRLKMYGRRYLDEADPNVGYAISGATVTSNTMLFRNGYIEFKARLPYMKGAFPAIWTMTSDAALQKAVPNYSKDLGDGCGIYGNRAFDLEFDLFESFADTDHFTTTIHKWYTNIKDYQKDEYGVYEAKILSRNGDIDFTSHFNQVSTLVDANKETGETVYKNYPKYGSFGSYALTQQYSAYYNDATKGYNWGYYFNEDDLATINEDYHIYSFLYTSDHCTVYFDGEAFLDFDWDIAYDFANKVDVSNNNNGVGYNFWQYLMYDMMIYTPEGGKQHGADKYLDAEDLPFEMLIDYVRIYQDPTDATQAIYYPAGQE